MDFPLVYVNGCSYSDPEFHSSLKDNTYAYHLGKMINGYVFNRARSGASNRRIIRTTVYDLINQRQLNPRQKIIALVQLTFEMRDELWLDEIRNNLDPCESNFRNHQFTAGSKDWKQQLLQGNLVTNQATSRHKDFLDQWSRGRAFFYSPYAARINLLLDLLMLQYLLQSLNIDYLIFQGPTAETLDQEHLKDFFQQHLDQSRILDLEKFGFCQWCQEQGFLPFDQDLDRMEIGHYRQDAHQAFAEKFLIEKIT